MLRAVGDALQYLHAKSIVHGNLRPENVLVTFGYEVKLLDVVPNGWLVNPTDALGVPARQPDKRDDVFGLACLGYEMLTGRHPFNGNTAQEAYRAGLEAASDRRPVAPPVAGAFERALRASRRPHAECRPVPRRIRRRRVREAAHDRGRRERASGKAGTRTDAGHAATRHRRTRRARGTGAPRNRGQADPAACGDHPRHRGLAQPGPGARILDAADGVDRSEHEDRGPHGRACSGNARRGRTACAGSRRDRPGARDGARSRRQRSAAVQPGAARTSGSRTRRGGAIRGFRRGAEASAATTPVEPPTPQPVIAEQRPAAAPSVARAAPAGPTRFSFPQSVTTVREGDVAARIVIRRSGDLSGAALGVLVDRRRHGTGRFRLRRPRRAH